MKEAVSQRRAGVWEPVVVVEGVPAQLLDSGLRRNDG